MSDKKSFPELIMAWWEKRCSEIEMILEMGDDVRELKVRCDDDSYLTITGEQKSDILSGIHSIAPPLLAAEFPSPEGLTDSEYGLLISEWHEEAFLEIRPQSKAGGEALAFKLLVDLFKLPFKLTISADDDCSVTIGAGYV